MFRIVTFILLFSFSAQAADLTTWNSKAGLARLENSKYKNDFYQLANFYQPQINPVYCAVASSVIVLNAFEQGSVPNQKELAIAKPSGGVLEYHAYSQINFLNDKTDAIKKREVILFQKTDAKNEYDPGLTLFDLSSMLSKVYKLKTKIIYADKNDERALEKFRSDLQKYLQDATNFIIVNFDGKTLGTKTGGHISPLAAYDEASDSVLVLDVALHKGTTWYFAPVKELWAAMNTKDGQNYRGYLIVSK